VHDPTQNTMGAKIIAIRLRKPSLQNLEWTATKKGRRGMPSNDASIAPTTT